MKIKLIGTSARMHVEVACKEFCLSYNTPVGYVDFIDEVCYVSDKRFSTTSTKHMNAWKRSYENKFFKIEKLSQHEIQLMWDSIA